MQYSVVDATDRGHARSDDRSIAGAGIGLRHCHLEQVLRERPPVPWLELLADNHLAAGGLEHAGLEAISVRYPLTLHCVGMNLAGCDPLDHKYLRQIIQLRERTGAAWVSDHLCFTAHNRRHYHELLPFPYTEEALRHVSERVLAVQDLLQAPLVVENVSAYLRFADSSLSEAEFLAALTHATDCELLLDLNNLYVNHVNHGDDVDAYLAALPLARVREVHLAGHAVKPGYLLDAHNDRVSPPVWALFRRLVQALPEVPVLIEWDNDIPALPVLLAEAERARTERATALAARTSAAGVAADGRTQTAESVSPC
ncbi:DUF692 domain-containing protein [Halochromatium glycolicum]|uniref:Uncharacterized protein n=1 Tax=Halochromatium glycolicum TaxID=85075 RepID=A0AAJ0U589_9GAMM|nr:DUF692 domain-containing protein [Halochromatium glycolicum]MBK1705519.1 hypothetical protein [Halochromatium glycolicum]